MPKFTFGTKPLSTGKPTFQFKPTTPMPLVGKSGSMDVGARFTPTPPTPTARVAPTLYNPAILPTFNKTGKVVKDVGEYKKGLLTGLDYFNRYTETALGTLGAVSETAGFALNKDTWSIFTDKMKQMYSQIWSPSAIEEKDVLGSVGRAAKNTLSLAGTAIVMWQISTAVTQTAKQVRLNNRRIAYAKSQLPKEGTVAGLEAGGVGKLPSIRAGNLGATKAEEASWITYATKNLGTTKAQAQEALSLMKEVASSPYAEPTATIYGSAAKEPGFGIGQSFQPHVVSTVTQAVEGLPAGQNIVLNFITKNPAAAVRIGIIPDTRAVTTLANLAKAVNAGQATIAGLQAAMQSSIRSLEVLSHYADLSKEPIEKAMQEQFNLAVPVDQPRTVAGGVKPAPRFRLSLPPVSSPAVAISPQEARVPTPPSGITPQMAPIAESQVGRRTVAPMTRQYVQAEMKRLVDAGDTAGAQALIEQVRNEGRIDTLTGLKNWVGWEEADKQGKIVASGDLSGLKYINDTYGHDFGDSLLKMVAAAFQANNVDAYRPHGDEFLALFASQEEADTGMAAVQQTLSEQELLVTINGVTKALTGWRIDYGTGQDYASADAALLADRADREAKGLRPARGTNPLGTPAVAAQGIAAQTAADRTVSQIRPRPAEEIAPPSTEQPSVVPLTRDSLIGYQEDWGPKQPKWEIVGFNKQGAPLWRDVNHPEPGRLRVLRSEDATWVKEQLAQKNRTPEQVAQDEAQGVVDNKKAAEIISGAFSQVVQPTGKPSVTNLSTLPAGQTTSGQEVTPSYASNEPNLATSGTSQAIPADNESISRMTVAFDQIEEHLGAKKSEVKAVEGTFQQAFATFLKQSGIPKGALSWEQALDWYKASRGEKSFAKRVEMVKRSVEKYNRGIEEQQRKPILAEISSIQSKANTSHLGTKSVIAIHNLMAHYRKGKLTEAHREELEETLAWVNNNPDTELPANVLKQLGELDKEALSTMSIPDLQKLQKTLTSLYQKGQAERHQFQLRQALQLGQDVRYIKENGKSLGSVMRGQPTGPISYVKKMGENVRLGELFRTTAQRLFKRMGLEKFKSTFDDKHSHFAYVRNHYDTELGTIVREEHLKHEDMENLTRYTIKQQRPSQLVDVFNMTPKEIEALTLTKGQKRLYDAVIRINKALFPSVQMTMAEQYNKIVVRQENFTHLPIASGEEVSYQQTPERLLSSHFHGLTKTTEQGFTIERKPYVRVKPEMDFLLSAKEYIRDAVYLIDCQPVIRRIYEAVGSSEAKGSIGEVGQVLLKLWSDVQARQGGVDSAYRIAALDKMVTKATYSIMGFKALTGAIQFTSIVDAIALIGPEAYMRGSVALLSPEWRTFIKNHASDIFSGETREVELAALLSMTGIKKLSMQHIIVMDALVRRANWLGGYYKYCSEHGLDFTTSTINKEGLAYASSVTTQAQGSTQAKELPLAISAGAMDYSTASGKLTIKQNKSLMRVVHHFGTFNLYRYNNIKDTIWTEGFAKGNWKKGLSGIIWLWLVGTIVEAAIRRGYRELREKVFNLDDAEQQSFWEDILKGSVEVVPFIGPIISMFNYGNDPLPILQMLRDATAGVKSAIGGKSKETKARGIATALRGIGGLTGIPGSAQAAQIIKDLIPSRTKKKVKFTLPY